MSYTGGSPVTPPKGEAEVVDGVLVRSGPGAQAQRQGQARNGRKRVRERPWRARERVTYYDADARTCWEWGENFSRLTPMVCPRRTIKGASGFRTSCAQPGRALRRMGCD